MAENRNTTTVTRLTRYINRVQTLEMDMTMDTDDQIHALSEHLASIRGELEFMRMEVLRETGGIVEPRKQWGGPW